MSITTKTGDKKTSRFFSGEEAMKDDLRFETYGTLDELVAHLGLARSFIEHKNLSQDVRDLQVELFRLGGELATTDPDKLQWIKPTSKEHVQNLEEKMQAYEGEIKLPHSFLIPGAANASAALEVARTVSRRLERRMVAMANKDLLNNENALVYINRVSDYCFLLARMVEFYDGVPFDAKD